MRLIVSRRTPVILLPGAFGQELVYWNVWEWFLERDGFHVYATSFPRFTLSDIRVASRLLSDKVDEVLAVEDADKVSLVGHSMGGLIARHYMKFLGGHAKVARLACLGTPHHGTWTAATAPILTGTRQIVPGSPFLAELNDPSTHQGDVRITNVWTRWDGVVIPSHNALLHLPGVDNVEIPFTGHWGLLVSRKAYRVVQDALERSDAMQTITH